MKKSSGAVLFPTLLVMYLLLWPGACLVQSADPIGGSAEKLVSQLDRQIELDGRAIQLLEREFSAEKTGFRYPFSRQLYEALAVSLNRRGAVVSMHESGKEPLRLVGVYGPGEKHVEISLRLRRMGVDGGRDIASARTTIKRKLLDDQLFENSLQLVATGIVSQFAEEYVTDDVLGVTVSQPRPSDPRTPTVRFGSRLKHHLTQALQRSETFGAVAVAGYGKVRLRLESSYEISDRVRVEARLVDENGRTRAAGSGEVSLQSLEPGDTDPIKDQGGGVCIDYIAASHRAPKPGSAMADRLVAELAEVLGSVNVQATRCSPDFAGIRVNSSVVVSRKSTTDGYGILLGNLQLEVREKQGVRGTISEKAKVISAGDKDLAREQLVEKLITAQLRERLTGYVLSVAAPVTN